MEQCVVCDRVRPISRMRYGKYDREVGKDIYDGSTMRRGSSHSASFGSSGRTRITNSSSSGTRSAHSVRLLALVGRALEIAECSPTAFGHIVCGQGDLISSIQAGRRPGRSMRLRIEGAARRLIDDACNRAVAKLMDGLGERDFPKFVEALIERIDDAAGDVDLEDSEAGETAVDELGRYLHESRIGESGRVPCEDAEPDDDAKGDLSWSEWHSRGRHKTTPQGAESATHGINGWQLTDDDEDDDPNEADGDEHDGNGSEEDFMHHGWSGPGCPIADAGEHEDEGGGHCLTFGIDQTKALGELEAFHDLNGIPMIRVPVPANEQ